MPPAAVDTIDAPESTQPLASRRACLACRQIKVRCISHETDERCRRCVRLELECNVPDHFRGVKGGAHGVRKGTRSIKGAAAAKAAAAAAAAAAGGAPADAGPVAVAAAAQPPTKKSKLSHLDVLAEAAQQPSPSVALLDGSISPSGSRSSASSHSRGVFVSHQPIHHSDNHAVAPDEAPLQHAPKPVPVQAMPHALHAASFSVHNSAVAQPAPTAPSSDPAAQPLAATVWPQQNGHAEPIPAENGWAAAGPSELRSRSRSDDGGAVDDSRAATPRPAAMSMSHLLNTDSGHDALKSAALGSHVGSHVAGPAGATGTGASPGVQPSALETAATADCGVPDLVAANYLTEQELRQLMTCYFVRMNPVIALVSASPEHQERIRTRQRYRLLLAAICTTASKFILPHRYNVLARVTREGVSRLTVDLVHPTLPNIQALAILAFYNRPQDGTAFRYIRLAILLAIELGLPTTALQLSAAVGPHIPKLAEAQRTYMQLACFEAPLALQRNVPPLIDRSVMPSPRAWIESLGPYRTAIDVRIASSFEITGITIRLAQESKRAAAALPAGSLAASFEQASLLRGAIATAEEVFDRWLNPRDDTPLPSGTPCLHFHRLNVQLNYHQGLYVVFNQAQMSGPEYGRERREAFEAVSRLAVEVLSLLVEGAHGADGYFRFVHDQIILSIGAVVVWVLEFHPYMQPAQAARAVDLMRRAARKTLPFYHCELEHASTLARFFDRCCARLPAEEAAFEGKEDIDALGVPSDMQSIFSWVNHVGSSSLPYAADAAGIPPDFVPFTTEPAPSHADNGQDESSLAWLLQSLYVPQAGLLKGDELTPP